jgi:tetratricopeptide (TPR) repeat protein
MRIGVVSAVFAASLAAAMPAWAMGGDSGKPAPAPAAPPAAASKGGLTEAERAVRAREYQKAIDTLQQVIAREPRNVDALNYLAYSHRELGRHDSALAYYQQAMAINPNHRGLNEYLGQLYIRMGRIAEARAQLERLEKLCGGKCEEYQSLRAALAKAPGT